MKKTRSPIVKRSLAQQVYDHVKKQILSGKIAGGERIAEEKLGAELGVSRTPIREALRRLEEYGLVRLKARSYAEVIQIDLEEGKDISQVRARLECLAAGLLAERATEDDVAALRKLAKECKANLKRGQLAGIFEKDSALHLEIAARSGNRVLLELTERLDAKVQLLRLATCKTRSAIKNHISLHDPLIDAIAKHDARKAEALMERHVTASIRETRK
jgi:DNA-binding GntR family transcriptional regulator